LRQCRIPGGAGEHESSGTEVAAELSLDRIEELWNMLKLIDEYGIGASDETSWIIANSRPSRRVIAVDHPLPETLRESA
jgi:hypothetical protein